MDECTVCGIFTTIFDKNLMNGLACHKNYVFVGLSAFSVIKPFTSYLELQLLNKVSVLAILICVSLINANGNSVIEVLGF